MEVIGRRDQPNVRRLLAKSVEVGMLSFGPSILDMRIHRETVCQSSDEAGNIRAEMAFDVF